MKKSWSSALGTVNFKADHRLLLCLLADWADKENIVHVDLKIDIRLHKAHDFLRQFGIMSNLFELTVGAGTREDYVHLAVLIIVKFIVSWIIGKKRIDRVEARLNEVDHICHWVPFTLFCQVFHLVDLLAVQLVKVHLKLRKETGCAVVENHHNVLGR